MKINISIILIAILCLSCGSNYFDFNEDLQEFKAEDTYFGVLYINGTNDSSCYEIICKKGKHRKLNFKKLEDYVIIDCNTNDTLSFLILNKNSIYKIKHRSILDAAPGKMTIYVDNNYKLHKSGSVGSVSN